MWIVNLYRLSTYQYDSSYEFNRKYEAEEFVSGIDKKKYLATVTFESIGKNFDSDEFSDVADEVFTNCWKKVREREKNSFDRDG